MWSLDKLTFEPGELFVNLFIEQFWNHLKMLLQWRAFKNLKALRQRVQMVLLELIEEVIRSEAVLSVSSDWIYISLLKQALIFADTEKFVKIQTILRACNKVVG